MVWLFSSVIALMAMASLADHLMKRPDVQKWKEASAAARQMFDQMDIARATMTTNEWFLGLFNAVYYHRFWSWRRPIRSCISSLFALVLICLLLGWEGTSIANAIATGRYLVSVLVNVFVVNLIADYLSLQETRWVMERSQGCGFGGIFLWALFDIIVTGVIFIIVLVIVFSIKDAKIIIVYMDIGPFFMKEKMLPLFLSTYFTSVLWFGYITSVLGIRALTRVSPLLKTIFATIAESETPARATVGFLCGAVAVIYGIVYLTAIVVG